MGLLSTAVVLLRHFIRGTNYRVLSEEWYDEVWDHLKDVSIGKGEMFEKEGRIYRRFTASMGNDKFITITDDMDDGARVDDINLGWWEKTRLKYSGSVVIQRYW